MTTENDAIVPKVFPGFTYGDGSYEPPSITEGLTKREYFAADGYGNGWEEKDSISYTRNAIITDTVKGALFITADTTKPIIGIKIPSLFENHKGLNIPDGLYIK